MWLIVISVGIVYGVIKTAMVLSDKRTYANRTKCQMIVFIVVQAIFLLFTVWVYSWSFDGSLVVMMLFTQLIAIAPLTLICLPPHFDNDKNAGTIDWRDNK